MNQPPRPASNAEVLAAIARLQVEVRHDLGQLASGLRRATNSEIPRALRSSHDLSEHVSDAVHGLGATTAVSLASIDARLGKQEAARKTWTTKRLVAIGVGSFLATLLYQLGLQVLR